MNGAATVSVIMPTYNAESTVLGAVNSILDQTVKNLELIVCDDRSTDGTREVLSSIDDPRLKMLWNDRNLGPGPSRDVAIAASSAPWLAVIDADDEWTHNRLERMLLAAGDRDDIVVFDDLMMCHDSRGAMVPWKALHGTTAFGATGKGARDIEIEQYILAPRLLIKPLIPARIVRTLGIRHSERRFAEDAEFFLHLAMAGLRYRYLPEPLYLYRITPGSATAQAGDRTLMRQCMEFCAGLDGWPQSTKQAFESKIEMLRRNEVLYAIADDVRRGDWVAACRRGISSPAALKMLPGRLIRQIGYQMHRIAHNGAVR